jgi:L-lactate dehydrogenase complex protein LldE
LLIFNGFQDTKYGGEKVPPGMRILEKHQTVQLFGTCLIETMRPEAGQAVLRILESLNIAVEFPDGQTCCGQPAFNAGAWDDARAMARHTLDVFARSSSPIIVPSGSCCSMIVRHYPELLEGDSRYGSLARETASRTYEFTQFLVHALNVTSLHARWPERITYHSSCHLLRGLGIDKEPRSLLAQVDGAELVELPGATQCCGFGGIFAIKMSELSGAMLRRKLDNIESTGAQTLVGCDVSCLLHIAGGLRRRGSKISTRYIAEILAGMK